VGEQPIALAAGDIDGDGITDLVVVNNADNTISFLLGTTAGAFRVLPPRPFPGVEGAPTAIVMASLTGQTTPDLAVTHLLADRPGFVTLWRRDAQGDLTRLGDPIAVGTGPTALAAGDLDGDGRFDLVVANQSDGTVTVLMNRGGGMFEPAGAALRAGVEPVALALAAFDAPGRLDLAVLDRSTNSVLVFRNQGNGHFNPVPAEIPVGLRPIDLAVGDLDGDGRPDLAVVNQGDGTLTLLQNKGDGFPRLQQPDLPVGLGPRSVAVGPLDGDGQPVVAIATQEHNGRISLVRRVPAAPGAAVAYALANTPLEIGAAPRLVEMVDLHRADAGSRLDLVILNAGSGTVAVQLNKGAGAFQAGASFDTPLEEPSGLFAIGDFSSDGRADLVVVSRGDPAQGVPGQAHVLLGNGVGGFRPVEGPATLVGRMGEHLQSDAASITIMKFRPGTLHSPLIDPVAAEHTYRNQGFVVVGDFNEDGNLDAAVLNKADLTVSILLGDGHGLLSSAHVVSPLALPGSPTNVWGLVCAPFTLSQHVDLAVLAEYPSGPGVVVLAGNGHGGFAATASSPIHVELPGVPRQARPPSHFQAIDCRGDGKLDLLVGVSDCLLLLQGDGGGGFPTQSVILDARAGLLNAANTETPGTSSDAALLVTNATSLGPLAVGDINGDHKLDIVLTLLGPPEIVQFPVVVAGTLPGTLGFGSPIVVRDEREHHFGWTFFVLKGDGTGRFEPLAPTVPRPFVLSAIPHSLVLGDFDGEGRVDGVVATFADPGIIRLRNDGIGQFTLDPPIGQAARYLQATDINRDGLPELVCLVDDHTIGVYLSDAHA
jgi:hypothetical protein